MRLLLKVNDKQFLHQIQTTHIFLSKVYKPSPCYTISEKRGDKKMTIKIQFFDRLIKPWMLYFLQFIMLYK